MSAPQVCTRCRKRRIRCDLQLPACKNCRLADVECFFWDHALGQDMPCSYLYSLRQRVAGLKRDIELSTAGRQHHDHASSASVSSTAAAITALVDLSHGRGHVGSGTSPSVTSPDTSGGYHLLRAIAHIDGDDDDVAVVIPSQTTYIGPGSAGRLAETMLRGAVDWHAAKNVALPRRLREAESLRDGTLSQPTARPGMLAAPTSTASFSGTNTPPPLTVLHDPRKEAELHALVPLATQRALLEHFVGVVGPAAGASSYTLLPLEQEAALLRRAGSGCENPLKWANSNRGTPGAFATSIAFAVATALAARDLVDAGTGGGRLAALALRFRDDVQAIIGAGVQQQQQQQPPSSSSTEEGTTSMVDAGAAASPPLEATRWTATALAALALCEMVQPASGQLWDLLGAAVSVLADLREGYGLRRRVLDGDFVRLERTLLKLECLASLHLRRPSAFCEIQFAGDSWHQRQTQSSAVVVPTTPGVADLADPADPAAAVDDLVVLRSLRQIQQRLATFPRPPEHLLEGLIPVPLQVLAAPPLSSLFPAGSSLPPISVHSAMLYTALHPVVISVDGLASSSPRLFHIVAASACVLIDDYAQRGARHRIVSLWMAAERVVEAGIVWVAYVLWHRRQGAGNYVPGLDLGATMRPILQVSSLLAAWAARWQAGRAYVDAWEALVELLWGMV